MILSPQQRKTLTSEICQFLDSFREREPLTVAEWANRHRYVEKGVSPKPGKYSTDSFPYQREPQESFTDPDVQTTVLMWASRTGKTETLNNLDGYVIDHDPKNILVVYPTLESATKWRKQFFNPMVDATPRLRGKINTRSRSSDNTMLAIKYPGGVISAIGTNSPSGFRQIQAPVVRCDEIDAMEDGKEGDPITLAFRRADNYSDSIQVLSSTPTVKGKSRIESWMEKSDYRMWFCPCQKCGKRQVLMWAQVKWTFTENDSDVSDPERAVYVCEFCNYEHSDLEREEMVRQGEWRPTRPFNGVRGYWLNGLNTLMPAKKGYKTKLHQLVGEFLDAKHSDNPKEAMRVITNTVFAETSQEEADKKPEFHILYNRREAYNPSTILPLGVLVIGAGADVQDDRIEAEAVGFGLGEETWGLEYKVFMGDPRYPQVWDDLDNWLLQKWKHPCGDELGIISTCVDVGAPKTSRMGFEFARRRQARFVWATRGAKPVDFPFFRRAMKTKGAATLIMVGVNRLKSLLYSRMDIKEHGHGYMHFPRTEDGGDVCGYSENYFKMLTAEDPFTVYVQGVPYQRFENPGQKRNEGLDCRAYATAGFYMRNVNLEKIAKDMAAKMAAQKPKEATLEQEKPEPAPVHKIQQRPIRPRGWVGGWR